MKRSILKKTVDAGVRFRRARLCTHRGDDALSSPGAYANFLRYRMDTLPIAAISGDGAFNGGANPWPA